MKFAGPPPTDGAGSCADDSGDDVRCACGSLIARRTADGIEIKCRRCKRRVVLALDDSDGAAGPRAPPRSR